MSFRSEIAMFGQGVLWFQNKYKLIKVTIGLMKPMREVIGLGAFLTAKEAGGFPGGSSVRGGFGVTPTRFMLQR
jgi:hypothetical protein